jgi:hypothetical protein
MLVLTRRLSRSASVPGPAFARLTDEASDRPQGHPGGTEAFAGHQPLDMRLGIEAMTAFTPWHGPGEKPLTFVVTERVRT